MNTFISKFFNNLRAGVFVVPACISLIAAAVSCKKDSEVGFVGNILVSGVVYDDNTKNGVENIAVYLSSYEENDRKFAFPISTVSTVTGPDGEFQIATTGMSTGWKYRITAADTDGDLNGKYKPYEGMVLHVSFSGPYYDSRTKTLNVENLTVPISEE